MEPEVCTLPILSEIRLINIAVTKRHTFTETGITFICNHSNFSVVCVNATLPLDNLPLSLSSYLCKVLNVPSETMKYQEVEI